MIDIDLNGKVVLVTGAAGTIGQAICALFTQAGATVVGVDRIGDPPVHSIDVTDESSLRRLLVDLGPAQLTDVVHAAGSVITGTVFNTELATVEHLLRTNLLSTFAIARTVLPQVPPGGSFTIISSQAAHHGAGGWSAYCASKSGVMRLTESLAKELGPLGIRTNSVCPGSVDSVVMSTHFANVAKQEGTKAEAVRQRYVTGNPLGRLATAYDVASACLFLASPLANYVNGASLNVDGGEAPG